MQWREQGLAERENGENVEHDTARQRVSGIGRSAGSYRWLPSGAEVRIDYKNVDVEGVLLRDELAGPLRYTFEVKDYEGTLLLGECTAFVNDHQPLIRSGRIDHAWLISISPAGRQTVDGAELALSFEDFTGITLGGVGFDCNEPTDEGIMYISAEGGWQAPITKTNDVLYDAGFTEIDDVIAALDDMIDTEAWVEREFYRGTDSQRLTWGGVASTASRRTTPASSFSKMVTLSATR